jgi:hypothetical protein
MVMHAKDLILKYNLNNGGSHKTWIDASQPGFIRSLKYQIPGEVKDYERLIEKARQDNRSDQLYHYMDIVPVNFSTKHKTMLANLKKWLDMGRMAIDSEQFPELMTELRIATSDEDLSLEKSKEYTFDLLDSLRLAMELIKN